MDLYWLLETDEEREQALAVVGVDGHDRHFRPLGGEAGCWPTDIGALRLHPVRTHPLTDDVEEALEILVDRVHEVADRPLDH